MTRSAADPQAPGSSRLEVSFSQPEGTHGWIFLALGFQAPDGTWRRDTADISYAYCPFQPLIWWMEALVRRTPWRSPATRRPRAWLYARKGGVLIYWEDEGSEVYLLYLRGRLLFKCKTHDDRWWRLRIPAREVATSFYRAFRHFVETGYDRSRYEQLRCLRERLACNLHPYRTQTSLLLAVSRLQLPEAIKELDDRLGLYQGPENQASLASMLRGWPTASRRRRIRILRRALTSPNYQFGSDTELARLRSQLLERCVAHERRRSSTG